MRRVLGPVLLLCVGMLALYAACAPSGHEGGDLLQQIKIAEDQRLPRAASLIDALKRGNRAEQIAAVRAMGRIQSPHYLAALGGAIAGADREVRLSAANAVGQLGLLPGQPVDPSAADLVRPLLGDEDAALVATALAALGKLAQPGAAEEIFPLLTHRDPAVRVEAAYGLFRCRFAPLWRGETKEPPALPAAAVNALTAAMRDPLPDVRLAATYAFSRYGDERARSALIDAATDRDDGVRLFAVRGLGHVVNDAVAPHLIARLRDDSAAVRTEAVTALGHGGRFDTLDRVRDDESFHVRAAVASALAAAHTPDSLKVLRELTQDRAISVQVAAIEALGQRLGPAVLERLEEWATHEDWRIRVAAARVAGRLGDAGTFAHTRAAADPDLRIRAALLAGLVGQSAGDEIVLAALESDDLAIRAGGVARVAEREHLDRLALLAAVYDRCAGEDWIEVRESIVDALGTIPESERLLERIASTDEAPSVRRKAGAGSTAPAAAPQIELSPWIGSRAPIDAAVDLETRHGTLRIALFAADAPIHVAAFLERVDRGFYDGLIWHRVVSDFVIQGGDPRGDGWGSGGVTIRDEINAQRFGRGAVGMPKAGKDTGGCQIFITHVPTPHLDGNYTVFGQVIGGLDVIDAIELGDAILSARRAR